MQELLLAVGDPSLGLLRDVYKRQPLPRALSVTQRCSTCPVLWCTLTVASGTSLV